MKLRPFELFLIAFFAVMAVLAVALLSLYDAPEDPSARVVSGPVVIWGTLPREPIERFLDEVGRDVPSVSNVSYEYVDPREFNQRFVNALADRTNPDIILIPHEELVVHRSRLAPYSYEQYPLRDFRDRFVDGAEVFALTDGIYAVPLAVDPLVVFWNRSLFSAVGLLEAPSSWEQLVNNVVPRLTRREFDRSITQSAIAFGQSNNISHLTPILSMLALQAGSQFVRDGVEQYLVQFDDALGDGGGRPFTQALDFFLRFSNPTSGEYSWNRALPLDREAFVREELAMYFGMASEGVMIAGQNPNLSFDVAEVPKGEAVQSRLTYGRFYGIAIVENAPNLAGAYGAMNILADPVHGARLAREFSMAPATRAGLQQGSDDLFGRIAFRAAPVSRGWLAPGLLRTTDVFATTVERAAADRGNVDGAASEGVQRLQLAY
jgi:ABC-type glycerol-3-phosphate transport system substrate-binding protein